jgi:uncharacterized membrane protein YjjB (DUF3815 family)
VVSQKKAWACSILKMLLEIKLKHFFWGGVVGVMAAFFYYILMLYFETTVE